MEPMLLGAAALAIIGFALFLWRNHSCLSLRQQLQMTQQLLERVEQERNDLEQQVFSAQRRADQLSETLDATRSSLVREETRALGLATQIEQLQQLEARANKQISELNQTLSEDQRRSTRLETELREKQIQFEQQIRQFEENRALLKREFELLAQEILEKKGRTLSEQSHQSLSALLNPVRAELNGFKARLEQMHQVDNEQRVKLTTELTHLQQLNKAITDQAEHLTKALQGQKKLQGNWGELILENVLDSSGLRLGVDYRREVSVAGEEGRYRPDVVVYLPQKKHLIIDAKTSLSAYTRFVNAEDEVERQQALKEHASAVEARIQELSDKRYHKVEELNSPEVVIMFIPIESAYVEALKANESLFQSAIERQILVATPTTLLTSLNIVRQLWRFEDQSKHSAQLAERAERFYNKLNAFLMSMKDVGKRLDGARDSYDKALSQLYSGRGNLIKQAAEFKELGVSVQKELPEDLVEKAALELELGGETTENQNRNDT